NDSRYFSAWPFNSGLWQFADGEIAAGFMRGICDYNDPETLHHHVVDLDHGELMIVRSFDGGLSWDSENMTTVYKRPEFDEMIIKEKITVIPEKSYDPRQDGYCLFGGFGMCPKDNPGIAFTMVSTDRGKTWEKPQRLPYHAFHLISARPCYVVRDDGCVLLFGYGSREDGSEKCATPIVYYSENGGGSFHPRLSITARTAAAVFI
ncbi:MAG: sialidase family protein, partial [Planctomycetota bacterium]